MREFRSFLAPQIHQFIHHMQASQCWSDSSEKSLAYFDRYCREHYPGADVLTQEMVDGWCCKRDTENRSSCVTRISPIRSFVLFLNMRGLSSVQPPESMRHVKRSYLPHAFTEEELARFFRECDSVKAYDRKNSRVRKLTIPVFFRLLYSSGIRTNEARLLVRGDVSLSDGVLNIRQSKGYSQHYTVLHSSMLELMRRYDAAVEAVMPGREYFFPSARNGHYNCGWVVRTFSQLWEKANPSSHATAYDLRHHYAVTNINHWVSQGFEFHDRLMYLSKSMGHSKLESTRYYYSIVPALAQVLDEKTGESSNWMIPEVPEDEKAN